MKESDLRRTKLYTIKEKMNESMKRSDIKTMPQYFEKYINLVDDVELSQAFDDSIKQLGELDKKLLAKLDGKRYAPDKCWGLIPYRSRLPRKGSGF
jgi:hypothetical protein